MTAPPPPTYTQATGYPNPAPYPPAGSGYPPAGQGYPQGGPGYPPVAPGYPTAAPGYPPGTPGYPMPGGPGVYPPTSGAYPPKPYPPYGGNQGYNNQGSPYGGCAPLLPPPVRITTGQIISGEDECNNTDGNDWAGSSFNDKSIRRAFIKKVYLILTAQLSVTVAFISFFLFHKPTQQWIQGPGFWFYYVSYATFLVTYITLICCPSVRRKYPGNFICLAIFTLAFSYMTGTIASFYDVKSVLIAASITCLVTFSVSLFAMQTKIDFTLCGGLLFILSMVLMFFGLSCMIVYIVSGPNYILQCVYGALAALLFCLFLAYDTQMLMGKHKLALSPEEHIVGALQLYLDIVYLFLIILSFFGGKGN